MIYKIERNPETNKVTVTHQKHEQDKKKPLTHIPVHSPEGFEYGYSGSGPADLAVSILAHHLGESKQQVLAYWRKPLTGYRGKGSIAVDYHQDFKRMMIATLEGDKHQMTGDEVHEALAVIMSRRNVMI